MHLCFGPECRKEVFNLSSVTTDNVTLVFCFSCFSRDSFHLSIYIQMCVCVYASV